VSYLRTPRARFLVENLDLERATGYEGARWEHFQIAHLNDDSIFRVEDKSRQIAWSWLVAVEALPYAILQKTGTIFVSINLEEAKEKIRYARQALECIRLSGLPRLIIDNQLELEFDNGARLISMPSRPPRGKAQMNVRLDEFAHVQHDRKIYTAALPVISKGGNLRIGSSPLGASGVFWEVYSEALQRYPGYARKKTPWWEVQAFCLDVREAFRLAPAMETAERVELFGNDRIKALFANMLLEDFQQEYEAEFVDETTAWITWDEIAANQQADLLCAQATQRGERGGDVYGAIDQLRAWLDEHRVERVFAGGVDVGRTRNTTEIGLVGLNAAGSYPLRLTLTLDNVSFDAQKAAIGAVMRRLPVAKVHIDRSGLGMNLAENLEKEFPSKVEGVNFTMESKKLWATDVKMYMQQRKVPLPVDRDLAYQIHSIKRKVTAAKNMVFDTDRNEKHHADKFWMLALAVNAALNPPRRRREAPPTGGYQEY
jgi:phage FluMu gp28-like protein